MSGMTPARRVQLWRPGRIGYESGLAWQLARSAAVAAGRAPEALALLEHLPVFTLGVRGKREHLLASPAALAGRGAAVVDSDRGGDVTFHGPGQLVGYPILHLHERGLGAASYVRALEAALIEALATFGVSGERVPGRPGVWAGESKVAALGVRISRGREPPRLRPQRRHRPRLVRCDRPLRHRGRRRHFARAPAGHGAADA